MCGIFFFFCFLIFFLFLFLFFFSLILSGSTDPALITVSLFSLLLSLFSLSLSGGGWRRLHFRIWGNGKRSESVNDDAVEAENPGGAAYEGRKSWQRHIWRSEIAAATLHGGSQQLMVFLSFFLYFFSLCTIFFVVTNFFI